MSNTKLSVPLSLPGSTGKRLCFLGWLSPFVPVLNIANQIVNICTL